MENASKALIMAGSVLIALAIITSMIYVFQKGSEINMNIDVRQASLNMAAYNRKYEVYDNPSNSIYDIISLINMAYSYNKGFDYDKSQSVDIYVYTTQTKSTFLCCLKGNVGNETSTEAKFFRGIKKNEVSLGNNKKVSTFNLADCTIKELGKEGGTLKGDDKLSLTKIKVLPLDESIQPSEIKPETELVQKTVYKYIFNCLEVKYHPGGRVESMTFGCNINPNF